MKVVAFFVRHFLERGTEVAVYDYANYNETILNNKSIIICFSPKAQERHGLPSSAFSFPVFEQRFPIQTIESISEMKDLIIKYSIDVFYTLTHGSKPDIYQFDNQEIWQNCKTIKHCVFDLGGQESDIYCSISHTLNQNFQTNYPVLPHIVTMPSEIKMDLRRQLNIPKSAKVFGRYGGSDTFNIDFVLDAIKEYSLKHPETFFVFMNTPKFVENQENIIFLEPTSNKIVKTKFINTCDAMIHARLDGETFGLSIGEFAFQEKNIISYKNSTTNAHIDILGDKILLYDDQESFLNILENYDSMKKDMKQNSYKTFSPEYVMKIFSTLLA